MTDQKGPGRHVRFAYYRPGKEKPEEKCPVVFDGREGNRVFVRCAADDETGEPVRVAEGEEVVLRLYATHMTWPGESEPVRRTLRLGEPDPGDVVRARFGDRVVFRAGALALELDQLDRDAPTFKGGYGR